MEINQKENELHLYPINNNEYLGAINVDRSNMCNVSATTVILDQSGSMDEQVARFVTRIIPLVMWKLNYAENYGINLITFEARTTTHYLTSRELKNSNLKHEGGTYFAPAIEALRQILEKFAIDSPNVPMRVLTISDGAISDHVPAANETKKLVEFLAGSNLTINSQAVRLFTSNSQPDTKALSYLLQINNATTTKLYDAKVEFSDDTIANEIALFLQRDCFQNYQVLNFEKSIVLKFPWNTNASMRVILSPGWNVFWFRQVPGGVKLGNGRAVNVIVQNQLSLGVFHELMESKLDYIADHMVILKIVGTPEASGTVDKIFESLKRQEDALALKSLGSGNKVISNLLDGIAKNRTNFQDSKQMAEFLCNTKKEIEAQRERDRQKREEEKEKEAARLKKEKEAKEKAAEEEAARIKKLEEKAEEEAARIKKLEEEKAEEEAARIKKLEEEKAEEEAARVRKQEEEKAEEEVARVKKLEEEKEKAAEEDAVRIKKLEEEKVAEEEAAFIKRKEEELARIKREEADRMKQEEEERNKRDKERNRRAEEERIEKELDITGLKSNPDSELDSFQTVFILDEHLPGAKENRRVTEKIVPLMLSKLFCESSELVHLVTFVKYKTSFEQVRQSLVQILDGKKQIRILVLTNEKIRKRQEIENFAEMLIRFLSVSNYSFELQVVRLASTKSTTKQYKVVDININESNDFIAQQAAGFVDQQLDDLHTKDYVGKTDVGNCTCCFYYIIFVMIFILLILRYIYLFSKDN